MKFMYKSKDFRNFGYKKDAKIRFRRNAVGCPVCGELEVNKKGEVKHPAMDLWIARVFKNGFEINFSKSL